jgi:FkbH-like protein
VKRLDDILGTHGAYYLMRLSEAVALAMRPLSPGSEPRPLHLICGFTPLHLETFLKAHGRERFPEQGVTPAPGLFGDLQGNVERASLTPCESAIFIEWADLDPRLGLRHAAGWGQAQQRDICEEVKRRLERLAPAIERLAERALTVISTPALPLPPIGHTTGSQAGGFDLHLGALVNDFVRGLAGCANVRVISSQRLAEISPANARRDAKADLATGFPYTLPHTDALAKLTIDLLYPTTPRKGLITDLDDVVWKGILGEVGVGGVHWDLEHHAQVHGLYQQFIAAFAESGVLVGVASKNEAALVQEAFQRTDLLLKESSIFPLEANWGPKSESVERILKAWNVGADAIVFVDDSPMEVAEVQARFPSMTCFLFPKNDANELLSLLSQLRDLFGKPAVREEDRLRQTSLRHANEIDILKSGEAPPDFLAGLQATVTFDFRKDAADGRALELINKTNQFNLNGRRYTQGEWLGHLENANTFVLTVAYEDKFGPLGKIAVLTGRAGGSSLSVDSWVMSCRAFSRRIEHHTVASLFRHFGFDEIDFGYQPTDRNQPLQEFVKSCAIDSSGRVLVRREDVSTEFLPHQVKEIV